MKRSTLCSLIVFVTVLLFCSLPVCADNFAMPNPCSVGLSTITPASLASSACTAASTDGGPSLPTFGGKPPAVPEPAPVLLLGTVILIIGFARKRLLQRA